MTHFGAFEPLAHNIAERRSFAQATILPYYTAEQTYI